MHRIFFLEDIVHGTGKDNFNGFGNLLHPTILRKVIDVFKERVVYN